MISIKRCEEPPKSLAIEKIKSNGSYNQKDVREQLEQDFYGKCYLCEVKPIQDGGEIEHLVAHKGDLDKKFNWSNLFLSCGHCNSVKNREKYCATIIDCTEVEPSDLFLHELTAEGVKMRVLKESEVTLATAQLIEECFNGTTTYKRRIASGVRLDELHQEMQTFYNTMYKYKKTSKEYYRKQIVGLLGSGTKFTAFKRDYIRQHNLEYGELLSMKS